MNWEAIGAMGEIIGALAVVVSLAYLAVQIRTQNREAKAAAAHEIYEAFRESIGKWANRDNAEVLARANKDLDSLSDADRIILIAATQGILRVWEEAYHQHRQGRLDENIWQAMVNQYASFLANPSVKYVWALRKNYFTRDFHEFAEKVEITELRYK